MGFDSRQSLAVVAESAVPLLVVVILFFHPAASTSQTRAIAPVIEAEAPPERVLVLANETVDSDVLIDELSRMGADHKCVFHVVVPASPVETGTAATHGPRDVWPGDPEGGAGAARRHADHVAGSRIHRRRRTGVRIGRCGEHLPRAWSPSIPIRS